MTEMKLTKMQIEYLLFLKNNPRKKTITDASKYFDCSKVNAKKIMDRMLVLGLLYKDTNDFHLTKIGEKFANEYNQILEDSETILRHILKMDDEEVLKVSDELIHLENLREIIKDYSSHIKKIEKLKNSVKSDFVYSFDNTSKVSSIYANYIMCGDIDMLFSYQDDINSLKKDDIKEAFKKYFNKSNLTIGVLKNGQKE